MGDWGDKMSGLWLPLGALIISVFLVIMFFSKENTKNIETKIYSYMLILNLFYSILGAFGYWFSMYSGNLHIMVLIQKIYLVILLLLAHGIFLYYLSIAGLGDRIYKIIFKISIGFSLIMSILILATKVETIIDVAGQSLDVAGLSYYNAMVGVIVYFIGIIIATIVSSLNGKVGLHKKLPLIVFVPLFVGGLLLREYYPEIITETFFFAFFYLVMYHTIENPDMKMINKLEVARDTADKANRAKTEFLSSMSHEIRTPLNAIVGLSNDIASCKEELPTQVKENAEDIVDASNNLLEVVGNILDISKIESDKLEIAEKPYDFVAEIEELCRVDSMRIGDKSIDFKVDISDDIPYQLIGDKVHVKEIVNNLLTNAIKYTDSGSINVKITCNNDIDKSICNLKIMVEDTGRGIKKEYFDKIFDRFERLDVDRNSAVGGTGLGLAIAKELVTMMNGTIDVSSEVDKGSIFTVNIPQKIDRVNRPIDVSNPEKEKGDFSGKKVLVVDDNSLNIKVAKRVLSSFNLDIDEAISGQECIDKVKSGMRYDLILMDIMMPNMSGETTFEMLKRNPNFETPVIALTADAMSGSREKYLDKGFYDYVAKPFNKEQIEEKLNKVFGADIKEVVGNTPFSPFDESRFKGVDGVVVGEDKK